MSEDIVIPERNKLSVSYSRKVSDGNYGTTEATAWVQGDIATDASPADISEAAVLLLQTASVAVWDQLGLTYHTDDITGLLVEDVPAPKAGGPTPPQIGGGNSPAPAPGGGDLRIMNKGWSAEQYGELPVWLYSQARAAGVTAVFDNRLDRQGNQPWFKEAVARGGVGHGKDGSAKGFWPPK